MTRERGSGAAVSLVCVYNDADVLESCLARSVRTVLATAPDTELIAVDNRAGAFPTAGAALNHGARLANNPVVVFVHQDVYLHSLVDLERAAGRLLADERIGVLGAVGVDRRGRVVGRMRDRVVPIGRAAAEPEDVDSLDEVLFMVRRDDLVRDPISEDPRLAWHAYAVEYCLRSRRAGRRAVAMDIPLTHNSLTANLARLDVAHRTVGEAYPSLLPIHTTCGTVPKPDPRRPTRLARRARGADTWWRESLAAASVSRARTGGQVVLADIRVLVDDAARLGEMASIRAIDVHRGDAPATSAVGLERLGRPFSVATASVTAISEEIAGRSDSVLLLITDLVPSDLTDLPALDAAPHVIGFARDTGLWLLVGVAPEALTSLWRRRRNRPFGGLVPRRARAITAAGARVSSSTT